jgi:hypothetical protein
MNTLEIIGGITRHHFTDFAVTHIILTRGRGIKLPPPPKFPHLDQFIKTFCVVSWSVFDVLLALTRGLYHKLITSIIYGFRNKLECLSLNTRQGWKGLPGTSTLAYYRNRKLRM